MMITFFGPAGSGKTVQGQLLEREGWIWVSAGELIRESNDPELNAIMATGKLVPYEITNRLVETKLNDLDQNRVVLDGFPREMGEAEWLMEERRGGLYEVSLGVVLDVHQEELIDRMTKRGRADDTEDAIAERLNIYEAEVKSVVDYLERNGVKICHVDGVGEIEEIHQRILRELEKCNLVLSLSK